MSRLNVPIMLPARYAVNQFFSVFRLHAGAEQVSMRQVTVTNRDKRTRPPPTIQGAERVQPCPSNGGECDNGSWSCGTDRGTGNGPVSDRRRGAARAAALADLLEARRRELQLGGPVAFSAVPEPAPLSTVAPPSAMPSNAIPSDAAPRDFARKVENQLAFLQ